MGSKRMAKEIFICRKYFRRILEQLEKIYIRQNTIMWRYHLLGMNTQVMFIHVLENTFMDIGWFLAINKMVYMRFNLINHYYLNT